MTLLADLLARRMCKTIPTNRFNLTMILRSSIILLLACLAGGCNTTVPNSSTGSAAANMPLKEDQPLLVGIQNWQDMAEEMAEELAQRGDLFKDGQIVVVQPSEFNTAFANAYYKFVLKAFQDRNIPVINDPRVVDQELILTLSFNVQNIRHMNSKGSSGAAEGVGISVNKSVTGESAQPVGGDIEEVLVYTSLSDATRDVFVHTQIAYINVRESHFYLEQKIEKPKSLGTQSIPVINEKNI
jgi:hypothetical protein